MQYILFGISSLQKQLFISPLFLGFQLCYGSSGCERNPLFFMGGSVNSSNNNNNKHLSF